MSLQKQTEKLQDFIKQNSELNLLSESDINVVYQDLIDCIVDHNHLYYIENKPIISDFEYDQFFSYLKKIEDNFPHFISSNSPTQWIVWQWIIQDWFEKAQHKVRLYSLENSYDSWDLKEFDDRVKKLLDKESIQNYTYTLEPKYDWIAVELIYENWNFKQAITRWDGQIWEDITENIKTIKSIPKKIKSDWLLSVRWEILMSKSQLEKLNKEREDNWQEVFANTRNACAGSVKLLDSKEVGKRWLDCFVYDLLYCSEELNFWSHVEILEYFKDLWLPVFPWLKKCNIIDEIVWYCDEKTKKEFLDKDYDFDGLVVKLNELKYRQLLWSTEHHPRRAIAYKFPAQQVATKILSVDWQVWRTWVLTPVANLEPVQLSWVTISRVSLHNYDFIKSKDIRPNDFVWVQRSGEVIPYVVSVIKERRTTDYTDWNDYTDLVKAPDKCPVCNSEVVNFDIHYYCPNLSCPAQIKEKIIHFVSKDCMDIAWIGESIVELLVDQKIINNSADLYKLLDINTQFLVRAMPWFGDKKIAEIVNWLESSKKKPLRRLINALGIPQVGKKNAQILVEKLKGETANLSVTSWHLSLSGETTVFKFEDLLKYLTDEEFLNTIYGFGEKTALGVNKFILSNKELLKKLFEIWLNFDVSKFDKTVLDNVDDKYWLVWEHFSITWTFPLTREKIVEEFEKLGAMFDDNPTKSTDFMLIGENSWSKKEKAEKNQIKIFEKRENIIKEFDFLKSIKPDQKQSNIKVASLF